MDRSDWVPPQFSLKRMLLIVTALAIVLAIGSGPTVLLACAVWHTSVVLHTC